MTEAEATETTTGLEDTVLRCSEVDARALEALLDRYDLTLRWVGEDDDIPGSHWGAPEAGIVGTDVFVRPDTPVHSLLHEAGHTLAVDPERRQTLDTDAGGTDAEEDAVCYLQILLADHLPGVGRTRLVRDMDAWGYSFRLGSAAAWFRDDADDARKWLVHHGLLDERGQLTWRRRETR